jgi:hypothetical protein
LIVFEPVPRGSSITPETKKRGTDHGEREAERLVREYESKLNLATSAAELSMLRKGDERRSILAALIRSRTAVSTTWIANRLKMGQPGSVSRQIGLVKKSRKLQKQVNELEKL